MIEGTEWVEILYPTPKTEERRKLEKEFEKLSEKYQKQMPQYEKFFNEVFPHIEF